MVTWKKDYQPTEITSRLNEIKLISETGVHFAGFEFRDLVVVLFSMLNFPDSVPEVDAREILTKAVLTVGKKPSITLQNLKTEINKLEAAYSKQIETPYVLCTSLSIDRNATLPNIRLGTVYIEFVSQLTHQFASEADKLKARAQDSLFADVPNNYITAKVHLSAKSIFQAVDKALDTIDLVRGIWNWFYNRQRFTTLSSGKRQPVNSVLAGPLHTLHTPEGALATDTWWYDPNYYSAVEVHAPGNEFDKLKKFYRSVRTRLARHKYRRGLENAIMRYSSALDDHNWDNAFLKLWGVLEHLTDSTYESNQVAIKRTAFIFQSRNYHLQVLNHLRDYRNRSIHAGAGNAEIEACLYQLKNYVEALMSFHLVNKFHFSSLKDAGGFLDLPFDTATLLTQTKLRQFALKFSKTKPETK